MNRWFHSAPRGWRFAALAWGISLLVWLPFEDSDTRMVMVFSLTGCLLAALRFLPQAQAGGVAFSSTRRSLALHLLAGALAGLGVGPAAVLLMAIKGGLHAHPSPDFSGGQVAAAVVGVPLWILVGAIAGLGVWLFEAGRKI